MNKIIFVNPPLSLFERYKFLKEAGSTFPNLGLMQLAAVAQQSGWDAKIIDAPSLNLDAAECLRQILDFKPDIVGFTAVTTAIVAAGEMATAIKESGCDATIIVGGPHVTAIPEETLTEFPDIDLGVLHEGEETLAELLEHGCNSSKLQDIDGIVYRKNGSIIVNKPRNSRTDLDALPFPAWDLVPGFPDKYKPTAYKFRKLPATYLVTSRGCPYICNFCDTRVFGRKFRFYSIPYIIEMIKVLKNTYNVREIIFEDDVFLINKRRVMEFCEALLKENLKISWSCNARADHVDEEVLRMIKRAGCWMISIGIESGDKDVLDLTAKNIKLDRVEAAVKLAKQVGVNTKGFFILGLPGDTEQTIANTISYAKRIGLSDVSVSKMTPFPGTDIYDNGSAYGSFDKNWKEMNLINSVYIPDGMSYDKIDYYHRKFLKEFYFRESVVRNYVHRVVLNPNLFTIYVKSAWGLTRNLFYSKKNSLQR